MSLNKMIRMEDDIAYLKKQLEVMDQTIGKLKDTITKFDLHLASAEITLRNIQEAMKNENR